jgi:hypothetical protein
MAVRNSNRPRGARRRADILSVQAETKIVLARIKLRRAQDVLSALAFCADREAELSLGPVAVTVRDLIDYALEGLATLLPEQENGDQGPGEAAVSDG